MFGGALLYLWFLKTKPGFTGNTTSEQFFLHDTVFLLMAAISEPLLPVAKETRNSVFCRSLSSEQLLTLYSSDESLSKIGVIKA